MYKRFAFEGDIHASLACVPLTVRRKLDLAALKVSLDGWQQLTREERLCLCHLPVDSAEEVAVYREVMLGFCRRREVPCKPLDDARVAHRAWNAATIPEELLARAAHLGAGLTVDRWMGLDEESRYALYKLADPKRGSEKLEAALVELGLLAGDAPVLRPSVSVCDAVAADRPA